MRRWQVVSDWFSREPIVYEAETAEEAAEQFAEDIQRAFGWRPRVQVMLDDSVAIRWHRDYEEGGRMFDGQEGFDRGTWLRHPNWETVLVPMAE